MGTLLQVRFYNWIFLLLLFPLIINADYVEGIDSTDTNGFGMDSSFQVSTSRGIIGTNKILRLIYYYQESDAGYFHYAFDDLKIAPASPKYNDPPRFSIIKPIYYCFVIQNKDSTYAKIQVTSKLQDNRYTVRYGINTTPNSRFFVPEEYSRSIRYKPNNLHLCFTYNYLKDDTISWDPPLSNDNHLIGYIFYTAKNSSEIDTTAPINLNQWDSTVINDTTCKIPCGQLIQYYNIVAVYSEGKSDFLQGWTRNSYPGVNIKPNSINVRDLHDKIKIRNTPDGLFISLLCHFKSSDCSIYNIAGKQIASFPYFRNNRFYNLSQRGLIKGQYIFKVEFPDRSVITQPFTIAR